jgi:hypothetical protein
MLGTKTTIARTFAFVVAAANLCAAAPDYFPLQVGNSWVYRVTQGRMSAPGTVEVQARETLDGREYFRVKFFENEKLYLRNGADGSVLTYDPELKQERTWLPSVLEEGQAVEVFMDQCSKDAVVRSKNAAIKTELGEFNNTLQLVYRPSCADAGVTEQYFLPYIGLLVHETTTIAGPVRHELVYSRTGSTAVDAKTNAFTLSLDAAKYKAGEDVRLMARVTLRVSQPVVLTFPSGQSSDLRILNEKGENVYTWSADKLFPMIYRGEVRIEGERSYAMEAPLGQLPPGKYTAEAWLTTQPRLYTAAVSFEIVR